MTKHLGTILTLLIVAFWVTMNTGLVLREIELSEMGRFERGVTAYLGTDLRRAAASESS